MSELHSGFSFCVMYWQYESVVLNLPTSLPLPQCKCASLYFSVPVLDSGWGVPGRQ